MPPKYGPPKYPHRNVVAFKLKSLLQMPFVQDMEHQGIPVRDINYYLFQKCKIEINPSNYGFQSMKDFLEALEKDCHISLKYGYVKAYGCRRVNDDVDPNEWQNLLQSYQKKFNSLESGEGTNSPPDEKQQYAEAYGTRPPDGTVSFKNHDFVQVNEYLCSDE